MSTSNNHFSPRRNFIFLLFLSISGMVISCWALMMLLVLTTGGPIFQDPSQLSMDLFGVFVLPFILAVIVSLSSLILTAVLRQKWWIALPISVILLGAPLVAYIITWIASWIARLFYQPTAEDEERTQRFLSLSVLPSEKRTETIRPDDDVESLRKLKLLKDEGILSAEEFETQKQRFMDNLNATQTYQNLPRFFSIWQAAITALFGGFLAGAVMIAINHSRLHAKDHAMASVIFGFIGHLVSLAISASIAIFFTSINPLFVIPVTFVNPIIIYLWYNESQKPTVGQSFSTKQARAESWWMVLGINFLAVIFAYVSLIPIVVLLSIFYPTWAG